MEWLKNMVVKLVGKKWVEQGIEKVGLSKAKAAAIVYVLIIGVETISASFGHPVVVPANVKEFLAALGLWAVRDAVTTAEK